MMAESPPASPAGAPASPVPKPLQPSSVIVARRTLYVAAALWVPLLWAGERALIDTSRSPHAQMHMVDLGDVKWTGGLLGERFEACRATMVPHL